MPSRRRATAAVTDHRTRVGQQRRERTRARILAAALEVFAERGTEAPVIDDFIRAAGIARGTFYTYFRTTAELLVAASADLEDRLMVAIEAALAGRTDPVERLATGTRLWLRRARDDRVLCGFVIRSQLRGRLVEETLVKDLRAGHRRGAFRIGTVAVARDLVVGTIREAMARMLAGPVPRAYPDQVAAAILQGLGTGGRDIRRLLAMPVPVLTGEGSAATAKGPSSPA
ncbi:MAG: TetR/AcrR family transcriptional regulator [Chromatiales bacterium]|jgi:AcrR family transcriptional regulator|nr:TetR/AcrR family transcriptional regulator [Chromatiales bacterium]